MTALFSNILRFQISSFMNDGQDQNLLAYDFIDDSVGIQR